MSAPIRPAIIQTRIALDVLYASGNDTAELIKSISGAVEQTGRFQTGWDDDWEVGRFRTATLTKWQWMDTDCIRDDAVLLLGESDLYEIERQRALRDSEQERMRGRR